MLKEVACTNLSDLTIIICLGISSLSNNKTRGNLSPLNTRLPVPQNLTRTSPKISLACITILDSKSRVEYICFKTVFNFRILRVHPHGIFR